jgi:peroxiredoxin
MKERVRAFPIGLGLLTFLFTPLLFLRGAVTPPSVIGTKAPDFSLKDTTGKPVSLTDLKGKKAIVVLFVGTECPINNALMPRLAEMSKAYAPRGVQFLAINSNRQDSAERVAEHAKQYSLPFPVLKDDGNKVADLFAAERTPEAYVLDAEGNIRYRGRVDDQFGIGYKRAQPGRRDLAIALDEVLADKPVSQPTTPVAGCIIARAAPPKADGAITYTKDVALILQKNCQECHRPGQVGPFSLLTYEDAAAWADTIREVIQDGRMPPWYADPRYSHFSNDRRLPPNEREILLAWLDHGTPKGDDKDLPPPREYVEGWTIGKPDVILTMPEEFEVQAEMPKYGIPYKRFKVKTNFTEDRWVERAEVRAGSPGVVHHVIVFVLPPGGTFFPGNPRTPTLCGTAPGDMPLILQPGMAKMVPAGSELIFEMHYTPNGVKQKDRSAVGIVFAKEPPKYNVHSVPISNPIFRVPPGDENYKVEASFTFQDDGYIINFMPHLHVRGKDFTYEAIYPDGRKEILLSVPRYNFNWQSAYRLAKPHPMPKGAKVRCVAHFDNSAKNPNNPDPTKAVTWGDQTWEEMMIGWLDYIYENTNDNLPH